MKKKNKKILVFNGSPKKEKSDTLHITKAFLEGMKSVNNYDITMIDVIDKNINYCKGCFTCKKNGGKCIYNDDMKEILDECSTTGAMVSNIMGYGNQKGYKSQHHSGDYFVNLLPKIKVETVVSDEICEKLIAMISKRIPTGSYGDGKIFVYDVADAVRIRTGERGDDAL